MNLYQVAEEIARRLGEHLPEGRGRPAARLRRDAGSSRTTRTGAICLLFYEYFHGDNGAGLGASHQTGWTGIIARVMHLFATSTAGTDAPNSAKKPLLSRRDRRGLPNWLRQ